MSMQIALLTWLEFFVRVRIYWNVINPPWMSRESNHLLYPYKPFRHLTQSSVSEPGRMSSNQEHLTLASTKFDQQYLCTVIRSCFFTANTVKHLKSSPKEAVCSLWRSTRIDWRKNWAAWFDSIIDSAFSKKMNDILRFLSSLVILWSHKHWDTAQKWKNA